VRTELQSMASQAEIRVSPAKNGLSHVERGTSEAFSKSLEAASINLQPTTSQAELSTATCNTGTISRYLNTASIEQGFSETVSGTSSSRSGSEPEATVRTPFDPLPLEDNPPRDSWRDYFMTHQPGEWWKDEQTRQIFASMYGSKALVTLDYTGTVPENEDAKWVTNVPLDAEGKPFPSPAPWKEA
jgi:hypothetical protein